VSFSTLWRPTPTSVSGTVTMLENVLRTRAVYSWHLHDACCAEDRAREFLAEDRAQSAKVRDLDLYRLWRRAKNLRANIAKWLTANNPDHWDGGGGRLG
jgi:hypothetical protein